MEKFRGLQKETLSDETKEKLENLKNFGSGMKKRRFWAEKSECELFGRIVEQLNELS